MPHQLALKAKRHALPAPDAHGGQRSFAVAPVHLRLDDAGIAMEVVVIEPTGSETQVIGRIGSQAVTGVFRERIVAQPGSILKVSPDPNLIHLFDEAGQRFD